MRPLFIAVAIFLQLGSMAQDLNGIWRGSLTQEPGGCFPVYKLEIQLISVGGFCAGGLAGGASLIRIFSSPFCFLFRSARNGSR